MVAVPIVTLVWLLISLPLLGFVLVGLIRLFYRRAEKRELSQTTIGKDKNLNALKESCPARDKRLTWQWKLSLLFASLSMVIVFVLVAYTGGSTRFGLFGQTLFYLDALSLYFLIVINTVVFFVSLSLHGYITNFTIVYRDNPQGATLFYMCFHLCHFSMMLTVMVDSLVLLWMALVLTTISSALMAAYRVERKAVEAAWKYVILTSIGLVFALLGTLFLANAIPPELGLSLDWSYLILIAPSLDTAFVKLGFVFVLLGYGCKAGLAPLHSWVPDIQGTAPFPVGALMSGALLKCALYAILRFYSLTNANIQDGGQYTSSILVIAGLLSFVTAAPFILRKNLFKRVMGYHSVAHMGIITLGLGIGGRIALLGSLFHILNHALTKMLAYLVHGNVACRYLKAGVNESDFLGLRSTMPRSALVLTLAGLALAGVPPFSMFLSQFLILWEVFNQIHTSGAWWLIGTVTVFLLASMVIFAGIMRHLGWMLFGDAEAGELKGIKDKETFKEYAHLFVLLVLIVVLGITIPGSSLFDLSALLDECVVILQTGVLP